MIFENLSCKTFQNMSYCCKINNLLSFIISSSIGGEVLLDGSPEIIYNENQLRFN
jgi:hypothetical protein